MANFVRFAQYLCVVISFWIADTVYAQHSHYLDSSNFNQLYRHTDEALTQVLRHGDSESSFMQLEAPIQFYSESYDHIYINTNGILTFVTEFPEYLNQPFPLEYPSIAVFYSNVDTSAGNDSTVISLFKSQNSEKLQKASSLIRYSFPDEYDFEATTMYVATWENVGYFEGKSDKLNTFQAVIITSKDETYVQFIYPTGGINWLQADTGELGLPDIRAQAGFISEDGRFFNIDGSGTDNARYFTKLSNVGVNGVFLYHVGLLDYSGNVQEPINEETVTESVEPTSCAEDHYRKCHSTASCIDKSVGFCCKCLEGYYGNGESCIKNNAPIRVTGTLTGTINDKPIDSSAKLQSYIVIQDGRSYTAVNPISSDLGAQLKLALPIVSSIGWLFAKPISAEGLNGYQLTGGQLTHNSKLSFTSGEVLQVNQTFEGLNYWDQLTVRIDIFGRVPQIPYTEKFQMSDYIEEFKYTSPNTVTTLGERHIEIPSQNSAVRFNLEQSIAFERCALDDDINLSGSTYLQKVSKVTLEYFAQDQALRTGFLAKVGVDASSNPCTDKSVNCGENTLCIPEEDSYSCICKNGFTPQLIDESTEICVDIDECERGSHICDPNAECGNTPGGYTCTCYEDYVGNGNQCTLIGGNHIVESTTVGEYQDENKKEQERTEEENRIEEEKLREEESRKQEEESRRQEEESRRQEEESRRQEEESRGQEEESRTQEEESRRQDQERREEEAGRQEQERRDEEQENEDRREQENEHRREHEKWDNDEELNAEQDIDNEKYPEHNSDCYRCSKDANCVGGRCECHEGYNGDGFTCNYNCRTGIEVWEDGQCVMLSEEPEIEPSCTFFGDCSCPEGYDLSEEDNVCRSITSASQGKPSDSVPCDVDDACHKNATCEWSEQELRHICVCVRGYFGDGFTCTKIDESCTTHPDLCDVHATCEYNETIGKSECQCEPRYEGDGLHCKLAPECRSDADCGQSAYCDKGVCQCIQGYERDLSDFCVPAGMCGGTYCADNAMCRWDPKQSVQFCECMEGYTGDAIKSCKSIPTSCRVRNTCGVHASCQPSRVDPNQFECICNVGFYGDGYLCIEEQNCQNTPSLCDHNARCQSTNIGIACVCNPGYLGNGTSCRERPTHESGFLLISQGVVIVRVPFNGKFGRPISVASMAIGLDKDCVEGRVYWGDISAKKIVSAKYDGTDGRPFITEDIESPEGIAIDSVSRRIYWTDSVKDTIEVASLEDPNMRTVLVNKYLVNPRGIAVDPYREKLYWSDWNRESPKIEVADLDGTAREILLANPSVVLPNSLVVLKDSGELCFADAGSHKIECIDSYTKQIRTVGSDLSYPFGLAGTENNFYWTDWTTKKLESVDIYGKRQQGIRTPVFGSHKMYGMTAVEESCPQVSSPCQIINGGCPDARICLANRKSPSGKSCKCTKLSKTCNSRYYDENIEQFV